MLKFANLIENSFIATRNGVVTYYQTLEEVPWSLSLEKPKNDKFSKKNANICVIKMLKTIPLP